MYDTVISDRQLIVKTEKCGTFKTVNTICLIKRKNRIG